METIATVGGEEEEVRREAREREVGPEPKIRTS